jgi:hypothetical protein
MLLRHDYSPTNRADMMICVFLTCSQATHMIIHFFLMFLGGVSILQRGFASQGF